MPLEGGLHEGRASGHSVHCCVPSTKFPRTSWDTARGAQEAHPSRTRPPASALRRALSGVPCPVPAGLQSQPARRAMSGGLSVAVKNAFKAMSGFLTSRERKQMHWLTLCCCGRSPASGFLGSWAKLENLWPLGQQGE